MRLAAKGRFGAAAEALRRAVAARPRDPLPLVHLAQAQSACGREAEALASARAAVALAPDAPAVLLMAGEVLFDCGDEPAARDLFVRAVRRSPSNPLARAYAALARWRLSDDPQTLERLRGRGLPDSVEFGARLLLALEERLREGAAEAPEVSSDTAPLRRFLGARPLRGFRPAGARGGRA